jgi:putative colanic acid biosysnthesis UDP-glucose lipid carrier transferase
LSPAGPIRERSTSISVLQRLGDAILVFCVLRVAMLVYRTHWSASYAAATVIAIVGFLLLAEFNGLYRSAHGTTVASILASATTTWILVLGGMLTLGFATKTSSDFSRVCIAAWALGVPITMGIWRIALQITSHQLRRRGFQTQTVAIAGCTSTAEQLLQSFTSEPSFGIVVRGVYDDRAAPRRHPGIDQLAEMRGDLAQLVEDARDGKVDVVYIALPLRAELRSAELIRRLADTTATVYVVPDFFVFNLLHARWGTIGNVTILSIFDTPFQGIEGWLKRLEDLVLGTLALVMLAPIMVAVAIGVKITSPGAILFRQRRYGLSGREIYVLKFRTMTVCEDGPNVPQATLNDQRITAFGSFLRRTSLDELPQLFNVVGGSMSLVGPRPHAVAHNELYRNKIQGYMLRHKVKPGITGWAQVNGWRGETEMIEKMEKRVEHDLYYIHNWRLSLDIRILFLTVFGRRVRSNAR